MKINPLIKILYVDDEHINLELFKITYEDEFEVLIANSGFEGLEIVEKDKEIKLIISDMKMPLMNGLEFIRKVKNLNDKMPCIILSGYQRNEEILLALTEGVLVDYIMKPFDINHLKAKIIENFATC